MNLRQIRTIAFIGISIALVMCIGYVVKTFRDGETKWYFLVMGCGILLILLYQFIDSQNNNR